SGARSSTSRASTARSTARRSATSSRRPPGSDGTVDLGWTDRMIRSVHLSEVNGGVSQQDSNPKPSVVSAKSEEFWRKFFEQGGDTYRRMRWVFKQLPAEPRCLMCGAPFTGPGAPLMRVIGKRPSNANPNWCTGCFDYMTKHRGGAEVEGAFLFADIRGSTALAERLSSSEYHDLLERYFATATSAVFKYDGFVDKFVGDELVALFYPLLTGERFAERAVDA